MTLLVDEVKNPTSAVSNLTLDTSGNVTAGANLTVTNTLSVPGTLAISGTTTITGNPTLSGNPSFTGNPTFSNIPSFPSSLAMRNRIINGNMYIAQRATSATVTAGTGVPSAAAGTGYPCLDRWFVYSTGANVTAAQVAGAGSNKNLLQVTGAASVTAVGIGQRIEQLNSYDLAGQTCTLSVNMANSLLTTVTWTASYASTADTFGTIGTPTKTQIATGTFTVTSTLTQYTANIAVPAAATTGIEILFTVGAQISGTWQIGNVQFEAGSVATPFERRLYGQELALCQRYFPCYNWGTGNEFIGIGYSISTTQTVIMVPLPVSPRVSPTSYGGTLGGMTLRNASNSGGAVQSLSLNMSGSFSTMSILTNTTAGTPTIAAGQGAFLYSSSGPTQLYFTGCEL
jgi:hypothetical protein